MDDLKVHMGQLKMKTNVAKKVQEVKEEFAHEEEERSRELGESDSTSVKKESLGILDATEADLDKDLTVDYHPDTKPNNDATVDDIVSCCSPDIVVAFCIAVMRHYMAEETGWIDAVVACAAVPVDF